MSWNTLTPHERELISQTLTPTQLRVYILHLAGCSQRRTATMLGYRSKGTVSHHLQAAHNAIAALATKEPA